MEVHADVYHQALFKKVKKCPKYHIKKNIVQYTLDQEDRLFGRIIEIRSVHCSCRVRCICSGIARGCDVVQVVKIIVCRQVIVVVDKLALDVSKRRLE
jgi:hypothetical protein